MPENLVRPSADADGGEPLRVLRYFARKVCAEGIAVEAGADHVNLSPLSDEQTARAAGYVSLANWEWCVSEGWVAQLPVRGSRQARGYPVWHLTAKGRQALRRMLSEGPAAVSSAAPRKDRVGALEKEMRPQINPNESPIGWLARRRDKNGEPMISAEQLAAAERLRSDFWFAGMSPRVTTNWSTAAQGGCSSGRRQSGADMSDNMMAAATRVRNAINAVGPELGSILIDVCCHLNGLEAAERKAGWPLRSAKIVLQLALTRLARHYGLLPLAPSGRISRSAVRHWGSADYRPHINGPAGD